MSQHKLLADLDEMVFEDRERGYGAYVLRKKYPRHLMIGTGIISMLALSFTFGPLLAKDAEEVKTTAPPNIVCTFNKFAKPPAINKELPEPERIPELKPPKIRTEEFRIPDPTPESDLDPEEDPTITDIETLAEAPAIGFEAQEGSETGFVWGDLDGTDTEIPEVIVDSEPDPQAFIFADEEPIPVNMDEVKQLVGYPPIAKDAGIQGAVVIRVLVDKKGKYKKHIVINSAHPILAKAVEKRIEVLNFSPAIQGGKPIQFWVNIPFTFHLMN
ncbi:TonB family protein [Pontibacter sp. G13]|uniref:energy transducer TonB n=1 Tax=Pontibacter sp. G13 TaxID=3074898 RepID=UPI00288BF3F7|nr:TonB family protein [Pontibacter sp. G13]WNJ16704.1 TonB family protein [Pontibacter sp. G13]